MNPLNNFSFSKGVDSIKQKITSPFSNFFTREQKDALLKAAHERNDFKDGWFVITPYGKDGKERRADTVLLSADAMPHDMLTFGGQMRLSKDYYPGSSEPTVQVLGAQENDITIKGRFKAKRIKITGDVSFDAELWRKYPLFLQEQIEAIRVSGNLVRIQLGKEWQRYGFIQEAVFDMKTLADISYTLTFFIVSFQQPRDFIIVENQKVIPYNKNRELAQLMAEIRTEAAIVPDSFPRSFAEQINGAISDIAAAVNLVTGFVDTVLEEVNSLKASVQRALGLVQNTRNKISSYQRTIGGRNPEAGAVKVTRISGAYANAQYVGKVSAGMFSLTALLASLSTQLKAVTATIPLGRHRVQSGDTLQSIAMKFYNDSSKWESIYDHNKLSSSTLTLGSILEIPRV